MNKRILIVVLALAGPIAASEDGNWKQTLKQQYEQHLLVLRFPFQQVIRSLTLPDDLLKTRLQISGRSMDPSL